jgi:hypothetical protein
MTYIITKSGPSQPLYLELTAHGAYRHRLGEEGLMTASYAKPTPAESARAAEAPQTYLIRIHKTTPDLLHSFVRRIEASSLAVAIMIARIAFPGYDAEELP